MDAYIYVDGAQTQNAISLKVVESDDFEQYNTRYLYCITPVYTEDKTKYFKGEKNHKITCVLTVGDFIFWRIFFLD